ncbi:AAC(3) family N-acetyltransferase [Sporosarcina sp. resist]|uniref:AAC(3) family N-acetyltransferase n=1 Tax=Sporosarcina sp. resist TaxID=2762563 RepID=UPI00164E6B89|nr:AAC(3) family N-acetyltransferase [Sporosarcina sp. resist]QNK87239.1 AAC(3) family N-acetyltransferase [Sporosarcina sp. resist]
MMDYDKVIASFNLQKGDVVLIGSAMKGLALAARKVGEKLDLDKLIDKLIEEIGAEGTLLFPTYNWDFCSGIAFDYNNTVSKTGALSKAALKRNDFSRTKHPIYSFAVWGKDKERLISMNNKSAFSADSPLAYLHKNDAKMVMIDVDYQNSFTFFHYVEEMEQVAYRYMKEFTGTYIDENDETRIDTYSMYVRDIEKGVLTKVDDMGDEIDRKGVATVSVVHDVECRVVDLNRSYELIRYDIIHNEAKKLYVIE